MAGGYQRFGKVAFSASAFPDIRIKFFYLHEEFCGTGFGGVKVVYFALLITFIVRTEAPAHGVVISRPVFRHICVFIYLYSYSQCPSSHLL